MTMNPLVSVIIPAYNAASFIERCLFSLQKQTYSNIEIIIVDSQSTDNTKELIMRFNDPRIRYLHYEFCSQGVARNQGIKIAQGEFITFLDADDQFLPEKIERQIAFLRAQPEYDIAYCNALHFYSNQPKKIFKKKNRDNPSGDIFYHLLRASLINPNALMIPRKVFSEDQIYFSEDQNGRYGEEWDLVLKISRAGYHFGYMDEELVLVEIRSNSHTQWNLQWKMKETALNRIENFVNAMSPKEKEQYQTNDLLNSYQLKLAIAYLIGKSRKDFLNIFLRLYPNNLWKRILGYCISLTPKKIIILLWKLKQRNDLIRAT